MYNYYINRLVDLNNKHVGYRLSVCKSLGYLQIPCYGWNLYNKDVDTILTGLKEIWLDNGFVLGIPDTDDVEYEKFRLCRGYLSNFKFLEDDIPCSNNGSLFNSYTHSLKNIETAEELFKSLQKVKSYINYVNQLEKDKELSNKIFEDIYNSMSYMCDATYKCVSNEYLYMELACNFYDDLDSRLDSLCSKVSSIYQYNVSWRFICKDSLGWSKVLFIVS